MMPILGIESNSAEAGESLTTLKLSILSGITLRNALTLFLCLLRQNKPLVPDNRLSHTIYFPCSFS